MGRQLSLSLIAFAWAAVVLVTAPAVFGDAPAAAQAVQQTVAPTPAGGDSSLPRTALGDQPLRLGGGIAKSPSASVPGVAKALRWIISAWYWHWLG